jgi:tRNA (adenine37-N6)-methyltransferase
MPIGFVHTLRANTEDDRWGGAESWIVLSERFTPASVKGLGEFSHIEVLYQFHRADPSSVEFGERHPRNNPAWPSVGIFAQRGRNRPNLLGATICRILEIVGTRIRVAELDAVEGTPVLDIKPVMREFLPRGEILQPEWSREVMRDYWES